MSLNPKFSPKTIANLEIGFGLVMLITVEFSLFWGTEPFSSWFYPFAWWSYILMVDGIIYRIQGNSLIISRTPEFLVMIPWSVSIWLIFEMYNLRMENWYYVNIIDHQWLRWSGYFISYSTVLPGIFETTELLECLGLYSKAKTKARVVSNLHFPVFYLIGVLFLLLPLFFPRYCFPLVWLGFIFLLDPINYIHGSPSLIREWEEGHPRKLLLLLTSSLICGFLWEFWNYWAQSKWIYTVPFFDELKIFEMPLAGFLGFPPFAVECYVIYNFISLFRFRRNWEKDNYLSASRKRLPRKLLFISTIIIISFYIIAFWAIDRYTVNSYTSPIDRIPSLKKENIATLHRLGIYSVAEFLKQCSQEKDRKELQIHLNIPDRQFQELIESARLIKLKWMGIKNFLLLKKVGITTIEKLSRQKPSNLYHSLVKVNKSKIQPPTKARVKIWVREARKLVEKNHNYFE
ncbi:MAG: hypothetical protein DRG25_00750 [Deltaproteobacteria bacterium]|nr:MAG: hypothetical protein DRG25_00750 [Deltaproteobacteria bacterium]